MDSLENAKIKQQIFVADIKEQIVQLEKEKHEIDKKLEALRQKLKDNEDYVPDELPERSVEIFTI
jgi:uncharacterized coiled-coil protein SlyX